MLHDIHFKMLKTYIFVYRGYIGREIPESPKNKTTMKKTKSTS